MRETSNHTIPDRWPPGLTRTARPHEDLLTIVKRRKLQWYERVSRSSGLAKTILEGTVKGGRRLAEFQACPFLAVVFQPFPLVHRYECTLHRTFDQSSSQTQMKFEKRKKIVHKMLASNSRKPVEIANPETRLAVRHTSTRSSDKSISVVFVSL